MSKGRRVPPGQTSGRSRKLAEINIEVGSGFAYHARAPFVELVVDDHKLQMTPAKAREVAGMLTEAADAAEGDGFLVSFFQDELEVNEEQAGAILIKFRMYRERERERQVAHDEGEHP